MAGVLDVMAANGVAQHLPGACPFCSTPHQAMFHGVGSCPKVKAIEYHPDGRVKRVEFK